MHAIYAEKGLVYETIDKNGGGSVKDFTTVGSVLCW